MQAQTPSSNIIIDATDISQLLADTRTYARTHARTHPPRIQMMSSAFSTPSSSKKRKSRSGVGVKDESSVMTEHPHQLTPKDRCDLIEQFGDHVLVTPCIPVGCGLGVCVGTGSFGVTHVLHSENGSTGTVLKIQVVAEKAFHHEVRIQQAFAEAGIRAARTSIIYAGDSRRYTHEPTGWRDR